MTTVLRRSSALDKVRGLAIVLMLADHVLELTHTLPILRYTVTRLSMPLFFLISGHLVRRVNIPRVTSVMLIGIALPFYATWLDKPNVLYWYGFGVFFMVYSRWWMKHVMVILALTLYANSYSLVSGNSYAPVALWALMVIGQTMRREMFSIIPLPAFLAPIGRYPLTIYVSHILLFETIYRFA